jgi:hypothetical protein
MNNEPLNDTKYCSKSGGLRSLMYIGLPLEEQVKALHKDITKYELRVMGAKEDQKVQRRVDRFCYLLTFVIVGIVLAILSPTHEPIAFIDIGNGKDLGVFVSIILYVVVWAFFSMLCSSIVYMLAIPYSKQQIKRAKYNPSIPISEKVDFDKAMYTPITISFPIMLCIMFNILR